LSAINFEQLCGGIQGHAPRPVSLPDNRKMVQHFIADEPSVDDERNYEVTRCLACDALHLINQATGKPLGED
jgi:hypothetical protein